MAYCSRPLIGLNADFMSGEQQKPSVTYLYSGYYDSVIAAGAIPVVIPPMADEETIEQLVSTLDGFVLTGGADLDPRRDGYMLHPSLRLMDERRETFDRMLIQKIQQRRLPVLGIGAGMQLLNVALGGTLFLHIPEDLSRALPHRDTMDPYHRHALVVEKGTLLSRVYGDNEVRVNSLHHMAVDDVAPGFLVTARCPDSVIEAIESIDDQWFAIGTQFHPEAISATVLDKQIFREFVNGIIRRSDRFEETREQLLQSEMASSVAAETKKPLRKRRQTVTLVVEDGPVMPTTKSRKLAKTIKN